MKEFSTSPLPPPFFDVDAGELSNIDSYLRSNAAGGGGGGANGSQNIRRNKDVFSILGISSWVFKKKLHDKHRFRSHPFMSHLSKVSSVV